MKDTKIYYNQHSSSLKQQIKKPAIFIDSYGRTTAKALKCENFLEKQHVIVNKIS